MCDVNQKSLHAAAATAAAAATGQRSQCFIRFHNCSHRLYTLRRAHTHTRARSLSIIVYFSPTTFIQFFSRSFVTTYKMTSMATYHINKADCTISLNNK